MNISARGLAELAALEGIVTSRYKDSKGIWTIGIGHTSAAGPPDPATFTEYLTVDKALSLFKDDTKRYAADVSSILTVPVTQYEFDALVSFHYNTGAIRRASLVKSLNAGNRQQAAAQFMSWSTPPEVVGRRTKEMNLFRTGAYSTDPKANVYPATATGVVQWSRGKATSVLPLLGPDVDPLPQLPPNKVTIRLGSKGPVVAEWQSFLGIISDGDFGKKTETATINWQKSHNLVPDGVVGPKTWIAAGK